MIAPLIGITLGDPAGIGPEVLVKYQQQADLSDLRLVLIGSVWALREGATAAKAVMPELPIFTAAQQIPADGAGLIGILDLGLPRPQGFQFGQVQSSCGVEAVRAVEWAAKLCLSGRMAAMATCPINKKAVQAAGFVGDLGHQEILARMAGSDRTATMLMTPGLKVVHLSTHKPLREAVLYVTQARVLEKLQLTHRCFEHWGLARPRIAVAALNPHGGEEGLLGQEEIEELAPAVAAARSEHIDAAGPIPADSVFNRAIGGEFDAVLALFHDQGHIAVKVRDFHHSATVTLGLPFVRTSVDHGTAFDIAGQGKADSRGLAAAVRVASLLVQQQLAQL